MSNIRNTFFIGLLIVAHLVLLSGCDLVGKATDPKEEFKVVESMLHEKTLEREELAKQERELMDLIAERLKHTSEEKEIFEKTWFKAIEKATVPILEDSILRLKKIRENVDSSEESRRMSALNQFHQFMIDCPGDLSDIGVVKEVVSLFIMLCENIKQQIERGYEAHRQEVLSEAYQESLRNEDLGGTRWIERKKVVLAEEEKKLVDDICNKLNLNAKEKIRWVADMHRNKLETNRRDAESLLKYLQCVQHKLGSISGEEVEFMLKQLKQKLIDEIHVYTTIPNLQIAQEALVLFTSLQENFIEQIKIRDLEERKPCDNGIEIMMPLPDVSGEIEPPSTQALRTQGVYKSW